MEWIEVTGRSLEDATELALDRLGVSHADLEFEVLEDAKGGFLGVGRSDARIRARVKPLSREKPDDRRRGRAKNDRRRGRSRGGRKTKSSAPPPEQKVAASSQGEAADQPRPNGRRSKSAKRGAQKGPKQPPKDGGAAMTEDDEAVIDEQCDLAIDFLVGVLDAVDLDGEVDAGAPDDRIEVSVEGSDLGILIGPRGATLSALEELTQAVVKTHSTGGITRVRLDVGGYREQRQAALEEFARDLATRVRESGEALSLEPMGSRDRKIVHDTIAEIDDVETTSEGDEPRRRVVIRPGG